MTQNEINELKAKYGKIYKINLNKVDWYYRAMTRDEFKIYSSKSQEGDELSHLDLEDIVFELCNLNGIDSQKIKDVDAGVVTVIADAIMKATGFADDVEPEEL